MKDETSLVESYRVALQLAIDRGIDPIQAGAWDLGQAAIDAGLPLSTLLLAHHAAMAQALPTGEPALVTARAAGFLIAFLAPQEHAQARRRADYDALAEQKRALEQLPEVLLEGVPAMVYVAPWHGRPGEMLYVSPQSEALLGYSALDWIANPGLWLDRLNPEDRDQALGERVLAQAEGNAYVSEYRMRSRDGRDVWIHDEGQIIRDEDGQPQYWQGVLLDITLRKAAEQQAAVDERVRLARELHDSVTQTVTAIAMNARSMPKVWTIDPEQGRQQLKELETLAEIALAELRTLLLEMRPAELTGIPLPRLLGQLVTGMGGRSTVAVELAADALPLLPPEVQVAFYRIAQEALSNLARHSQAQSARIQLHQEAGCVVLTVVDDGVGFDPDAVPGGHLGIQGMHERAHAIGASLAVRSAPRQGTEIVLVWPTSLAGTDRSSGGFAR